MANSIAVFFRGIAPAAPAFNNHPPNPSAAVSTEALWQQKDYSWLKAQMMVAFFSNKVLVN